MSAMVRNAEGWIRTSTFSLWHLIYSQAPSPFGYLGHASGGRRTHKPEILSLGGLPPRVVSLED